MRRRVLLIVVSLSVILFGGYVLIFLSLMFTNPVNRFTIKKIEFGMTEEQVVTIFRGSAGDYSGLGSEKRIIESEKVWEQSRKPPVLPEGYTRKIWVGGEAGIALVFNERG